MTPGCRAAPGVFCFALGGGLERCAADLDCDVTPTEVKQVSLHFAKGGAKLGEVRVNGPLDLNKVVFNTEAHPLRKTW